MSSQLTDSLSGLKRQQSGPGASDRAGATQCAGARARAVAGRQTLPGSVLGHDGCRDWRRRLEAAALCWLAGAGARAGAGAGIIPQFNIKNAKRKMVLGLLMLQNLDVNVLSIQV